MNNLFSASQLSLAISNTATSAILLQTYSQAIASQPNISLSEVPSLSTDQQSVQQAAVWCLDNNVPDLIALSAQVIGYTNLYNQLYTKLLADAQVIDNPTAANRTEAAQSFLQALGLLQNNITDGTLQRNNSLRNTQLLVDTLASNQAALDGDLTIAKQQLLDTDIAALNAKLASIQQTIDADNQLIASGGVYGAVAGIKIAVGIFKGWFTDDPASAVETVVGQISGIVADSAKHSAAIADLQTQNVAYFDTLTSLLADEVIFAIVQNLAFNTDLLASHTSSAKMATNAYMDAWTSLAGTFADITNTLSKGPTATLNLSQNLQSANADWQQLLQLARSIQNFDNISTETTTIDSAVSV
jgi:hypothetical protein